MKRFLALIFSSALILGACGNNDTSNNDSDTKSESKTEKKSEDKKDNKSKEDKKSKEEKKSQENEDSKSTQENNSTEEQNTQETATNEQVQSQQQTQQTQRAATQERQQAQQNSEYDSTKHSDEYNASHPVSTDDDWTPEMIEENERLNKEMEANAKVAKENGYTGIPNGDVGGVPTPDKYYSDDQLDPDTGLPMEDAVPHDVE
ncbi:hypothetical protein CD034_03125 [Staphylococcus hominis subsp. hominis]|uniref:hypothetical protein n=1 Tax=Staphylococcus hominis TaxID=1290 RepID=UPI000CD0278B|nr:hypothetical protein [Staphylococcus hominis]AYY65703.1 hypothetical protein EGX58_01750 [Staphylococcus hominis]PNZ32559.1 hypothetical protein CD034_03125 [Staphylococcus hominis subsp. hominis]SUM42104.1 putative lipoprotein [Staphylococcus hominis]